MSHCTGKAAALEAEVKSCGLPSSLLSFQVDRLLAVADFGPPDERDDLAQDSSR